MILNLILGLLIWLSAVLLAALVTMVLIYRRTSRPSPPELRIVLIGDKFNPLIERALAFRIMRGGARRKPEPEDIEPTEGSE